VGAVSLPNTHPFTRELWGRYWAFAHNGQLADSIPATGPFRPVGDTESEAVFCHLLNTLAAHHDQPPTTTDLIETLSKACQPLLAKGVCNIMLSNGDWLYTLCTSKLHWITRRAPFGAAHLSDVEVSIDFTEHNGAKDVVG